MSARTLADVLSSTSDVLFPAESGATPVGVNTVGIDGDTPLHVMAWRNDVDGARLLIESGADVNAIGDMGETPLHIAVQQANAELVALLLRAGASADIKSEFGTTSREQAARKGGTIAELFGGE